MLTFQNLLFFEPKGDVGKGHFSLREYRCVSSFSPTDLFGESFAVSLLILFLEKCNKSNFSRNELCCCSQILLV